MKKRLLMIVNVDWFFLSHRLPVAVAALEEGYEVHIATRITRSVAELEKFGLIIHPVTLNRGKLGMLSILAYFFRLIFLMRSIKPNLIHLVTIKPVLIGGLATRIMKIPAVLYAISGMGYIYISKGLMHKLLRKFVSLLYRAALNHRNSVVVFQNLTDLEEVSRIANLKKGCCAIIKGSGVELALYKVSDLPTGRPIIMLPSRLLKDKGVYEFVDAARQFQRTNKDMCSPRFVLVGNTDPENKASLNDEQIEIWVQEGIVEYWGFKTNMASVLEQATLVVLPSYREGLPKVLLEAAACARPIVTTDVPGCRDAIIPDKTGKLIPAKDSNALALVIKELLLDPELLTNLGQAGRALAEENFDVRFVVEKHLKIYKSILANAHGK